MNRVALVLSFAFFALSAHAACDKPFVFFDLGQTLVDTDTNKYNPMFYYRLDAERYADAALYPTAKEYIDALNGQGYKLGLLTDIPGEWGLNYPPEAPVLDLPSAKVIRTIDFLSGKNPADGSSWIGTPLDWAPFVTIRGYGEDRRAIGRLLVPQNNEERKGAGSLVVFQRAKRIANAAGCPAIFQGEDEKEQELAERAGLIPFWVGHTRAGLFYLPVEDAADYVKSYHAGSWRGK